MSGGEVTPAGVAGPDPQGRRATVRLSDEARAALRPGDVLVIDWQAAARCAPPLGQVTVRRVDGGALTQAARFEPLGADGPTVVLAHRHLLDQLASRTVRIDYRRTRWHRSRLTTDLPPAFSLCVSVGEPPPP